MEAGHRRGLGIAQGHRAPRRKQADFKPDETKSKDNDMNVVPDCDVKRRARGPILR
jgi:hypothetical protein